MEQFLHSRRHGIGNARGSHLRRPHDLLLGDVAEVYVAAIAIVTNFFFLVSGGWLLILGTLHTGRPAQDTAPEL